jgi:hypothetical protein
MLNRLLCLAACIIATMSSAIAVLAQCKYVDPHDRSGYYAWCRCMGELPEKEMETPYATCPLTATSTHLIQWLTLVTNTVVGDTKLGRL